MASEQWQIHDGWFNAMHSGQVDTDTDQFAMRLYTNASNVNDTNVDSAGSVTGELTAGTGYSVGGQTVAVTMSEAGGVTKFDLADAQWTASGGSIVARYAAVIDVTAGLVVAHSTLEIPPSDVTATTGNTFTVEIAANGVYTTAQV